MKAPIKSITTKFSILALTLITSIGIAACSNNRSDSASAANQISAAANSEVNSNQSEIESEKEKLEKERANLEADKARLNKEKKELKTAKSATPPDVDTENWNGDIWQVPNPPSNIRTAPDRRILCTVKDKANINLRGTSNIKDKNGEWLYTDYCGKIGFIHSTQVQMVDGVPAG
jgi:gas vesicle protein